VRLILLSAVLAVISAPVSAANVAVSISVGEPGFYGQLDIVDFPKPELVNTKPVIIERRVLAIPPQPIYLHVPPGYEKNWRKHCHEYDACWKPVFFVRDKWYNDVYVARHREHMKHRVERRIDRKIERRKERRGAGP
jgi:hypothetical protein